MNIAFLLTPKSHTIYIYEDSTFRQALEKLRHHGYTAIPVLTRDGGYAGTLSEGDFLWSMLEIGGASLADCEGLHVSESADAIRRYISPLTPTNCSRAQWSKTLYRW